MEQTLSRRAAIRAGIAAAAATATLPAELLSAQSRQKFAAPHASAEPSWGVGLEGQRRADLGNGMYRNPVLSGDHPDPALIKDGETYYKVSSSFDYYPGLTVWKSPDLVNWVPVGPALRKRLGSVLGPDFAKVGSRYYIYFPVLNLDTQNLSGPRPYGQELPPVTVYVVYADNIEGPWSEPVDLKLPLIDPCHAIGEDGKRYLFLYGGVRVPLTDDGLKTDGKLKKVYDGWPIPADWAIEAVSLEGPKMMRRDGWFYMITAEGGTAGPPTGHMILVARSRSIDGPWENSPHNPLVRTLRVEEPWWSRGHGTILPGPGKDWWVVYHAMENGFRTMGRQMILEPVDWTADGWPRTLGGDLSRPLRMPAQVHPSASGEAFSDDFHVDHFGTRIFFFQPSSADYPSTAKLSDGGLAVLAAGKRPQDATLLVMNASDHKYTTTVELECSEGASAGLLLFYNKRAFCGLASDGKRLSAYRLAADSGISLRTNKGVGKRMFLKVRNDRDVASFFISPNGIDWTLACSFEVSGYNQNMFEGFLSLRPALFAQGEGLVTVRKVEYKAG